MSSEQPVVQIYNDQQAALLSTHFWTRNEPNVAWRHAVSSVMALPALRAVWPMSSVDYTVASRARDVAGAGYHLGDNNGVTFNYDQLAPHAEFDGINQYLSRADGGAANWADIIGTEAYVAPKSQGLTLGGWFYFDNVAAAVETMMGKYDTGANQRSYSLYRIGAGNARFAVSNNGIAAAGINEQILAPSLWYFIVGRYIPSTSIEIWVNGASSVLGAGIPAALFDGTAPFTVGAFGNPANYMDGRASMCWLCAAALSDSIITATYQQQRKMYNV